MYGCNPSTEEGGISLARFSALLVPDIAQFIFIGQAGKAEALPTCVPGQKKTKKKLPTTPDTSTGNSLEHAALDATFRKGF